ncbi:12234_t:CDS:2 [Entrophospora sp. SA101]|nr:2157_t:CDS:2 [Entrophospora sp. SA101]CAJ0644845.1 12234_t:CDS:2 [Entrophospora sp. SA101]CAJ0906831.1 12305_t:CDS:2 [Entrophospora sp. SA101]CAJ0908439.1 888_t:CDS:2 [Entrophospora sp. SA101]
MSPPLDPELKYRQPLQQNEIDNKYERNYVPPNITIKELRDVIPPHCFQRSTLKSMSYLAKDLIAIMILAYGATFIDKYIASLPLRFLAWSFYWFWCGAFATGIWVIGHECGHQSFSPSKKINNIVGFIFHSALLVPYHSWRISHSKHHKHTGHITKDQVFVPKTRSRRGIPQSYVAKDAMDDIDDKNNSSLQKGNHSVFEDTPIFILLNLIGQQLFGFPLYLSLNYSGSEIYDKLWTNHFDPTSPIFDPKHYGDVIISDIGMIGIFSIIGYSIYKFSLLAVVKYYLIPYLVVNHWLVMITFLQHTDPKLPHYRDGKWNFVRGAICTVDRHFGFLDSIFHRITSTHVAHHFFSQMPHYHAEEATEHLKKVLGPYYMFDDTPMFKALWRSYSKCKFIEDEGDIVFYKN